METNTNEYRRNIMCEPASMIVTKTKVFWSENTDSHSEIVSEFGLKETDARGDVNIIPIEITPPNGNLKTPLSKWVFKVDFAGFQRELPDWADLDKIEKECRLHLKDWAKKKLIKKPCVLKSGQYYVVSSGSATVWVSGSATVRAYDSATVEAYGSATVDAYGSATVRASGSATVWASDSATVEASDSATVRVSGSATVVSVSDRATAIAYNVVDPDCLKSKTAVLIDRSKSSVVCYVGE